MSKAFRNFVLKESYILTTREARQELDKLNYVQFCCVIKMFKDLNATFISDLSISKEHKKLYIGFGSMLRYYMVVMTFSGFLGLGKCSYEGTKVLNLFK